MLFFVCSLFFCSFFLPIRRYVLTRQFQFVLPFEYRKFHIFVYDVQLIELLIVAAANNWRHGKFLMNVFDDSLLGINLVDGSRLAST